ncbi:hypothetical protein [Kitasatospora griseola]|uniref:hypothetical protein n=1 Tax=Kitasatospora griseola TaxID=2064 RepID=UPI003413C3E2
MGADTPQPLDQEVFTAVGEQLSRRNGRHVLVPAVRTVLGKGLRADVGDLLVVGSFSIAARWAVQALDALLLGEAVARAAAGAPCVVATAPFLLRAGQGSQQVLAALRRTGFRPLAGHAMIAPAAGMDHLSGHSALLQHRVTE